MKRIVWLGIAGLAASSIFAADSTPKDDVKNAAKKLGDKPNYSWTTNIKSEGGGGGGGGGGQFRPGPTEGKTQKDLATTLSMTFGDNTTEAVLKGEKFAVKTQDGWKSSEELSQDAGGGQPNRGAIMGRMLRNFKAPAAQAAELADKAKELKATGEGVVAGDLTEEVAKEILSRGGGRGGGGQPQVAGAKGNAKFWIKDGALTKYEFNVQGKVTRGDRENEVNRTTTVEIKEVGTTKVTVPEEASKKL